MILHHVTPRGENLQKLDWQDHPIFGSYTYVPGKLPYSTWRTMKNRNFSSPLPRLADQATNEERYLFVDFTIQEIPITYDAASLLVTYSAISLIDRPCKLSSKFCYTHSGLLVFDFPTYSPQLPNARPLTRQGSCLFSETIILCNSLRIAIQKIGTPSRYGVRSGFVNMKPVDKYWVQHQLRSFQGDSDFGTLLSLLTNTQNPPSSVMALEWRQ
jgi:hypothetical protein